MALNLDFVKKSSFWTHLGAIAAGIGAGLAAGSKPVDLLVSILKSIFNG